MKNMDPIELLSVAPQDMEKETIPDYRRKLAEDQEVQRLRKELEQI